MTLSAPLGLLALLAVPAVLALHLFRRRLRARRVAALFLFAPDALAASAGRKRTRLLRSASLWLELAAAVLAALWLAGLSFGVSAARTHAVIVLDGSASMAARGPRSSTLERVRAFLAELAERLPSSAQITVIETAPRPEILAGPRAPAAWLPDALARYEPMRPKHDLGPALSLATDLAGEGDQLWLVTDAPFAQAPPSVSVRALGEPLANAGVLSVRRLRTGDTERLFVDVVAWSGAAMSSYVEVHTKGAPAPLARRDVVLEPRKPLHLELSLPRTDADIRITLPDDALAIDNEAVLLHEPLPHVRVANLLAAEVSGFLELEAALAAIDGVRVVSDPAAAHLVFTAAPGALLVSSAQDGRTEVVVGAAGAERDAWLGPFLIERRHALLESVTLEGVIWTAGRGVVPGLPIVSAGEQPLLTIEGQSGAAQQSGAARVWLNLDPARSNLPASPDWPILLANLVTRCREGLEGPVAVNVHVGDEIQLRSNASAEQLARTMLIAPGGARLPARGLRLLSWEARRPGIYVLDRSTAASAPPPSHPERAPVRFAARFADAAESDLTACASGEVAAAARMAARADADPRGAPSARGAGLEAKLLALLLLIVVVADWWVLSRR